MNNEIETMSTSSNEQVFFEFKDLPDTSTAINSKNLNGMQEKIKQSIDNKQSLPNGGTTGQVLGKASDSDYDVAWINQTGGGADYDAAPVGAMFDYPSLTPPIGYKICDGSELSRTEYSELFSVIGTTYGSGDGSNTFNLPNRLGRLSIGYNSDDDDFNALGKTGGSKTHTQTVEELAAHKHGLPAYTYRGGGNQIQSGSGIWYASNPKDYTDNTGDSQPMDIMNPYIVSCPIIKVTGTAILKGNVVDSLEDNSTTNAPSQRVVKETIGNLEQLQTTDKNSVVGAVNSSSHLIKDFTVESDTNEITINDLNLEIGKNYRLLVNGHSSGGSGLTNITLLPNGINSYSVSRIAGMENNNGSINSVFNTNTQALYIGRVYIGNNYSLDSLLLLNENYAKNISQYVTPGTDGSYCFGNLGGIVNIENVPVTSLKIKIASGQIKTGTNIKIYML